MKASWWRCSRDRRQWKKKERKGGEEANKKVLNGAVEQGTSPVLTNHKNVSTKRLGKEKTDQARLWTSVYWREVVGRAKVLLRLVVIGIPYLDTLKMILKPDGTQRLSCQNYIILVSSLLKPTLLRHEPMAQILSSKHLLNFLRLGSSFYSNPVIP